jgi:hypothetical protein
MVPKRYTFGTGTPRKWFDWCSWNERQNVGCSDKPSPLSAQAPRQVPMISGSARAGCLLHDSRHVLQPLGGATASAQRLAAQRGRDPLQRLGEALALDRLLFHLLGKALALTGPTLISTTESCRFGSDRSVTSLSRCLRLQTATARLLPAADLRSHEPEWIPVRRHGLPTASRNGCSRSRSCRTAVLLRFAVLQILRDSSVLLKPV